MKANVLIYKGLTLGKHGLRVLSPQPLALWQQGARPEFTHGSVKDPCPSKSVAGEGQGDFQR